MPSALDAFSTRPAGQLGCRCRWRFGADGPVLSWWCARGCPSGGEKTYPTVEQANRMADAMDPEPRTTAGLTVGATPTGGSGFIGTIDEPAIYAGALSSADIQAHHTTGITP